MNPPYLPWQLGVAGHMAQRGAQVVRQPRGKGVQLVVHGHQEDAVPGALLHGDLVAQGGDQAVAIGGGEAAAGAPPPARAGEGVCCVGNSGD